MAAWMDPYDVRPWSAAVPASHGPEELVVASVV